MFSFIDLALRGKVMFDEIDDYVDRWHDEPNGKTLSEYLGMSNDEYAAWVSNPDVVSHIVAARKMQRPFEQLIMSAYEERLAARADAPDRVAAMKRWLESRKK